MSILNGYLKLKCVHISEPIVNPDTDLVDHFLCDFADDNGNEIFGVEYPISDFFPLWFKEGDWCIIPIVRADILLIGKPVED